MPDGTGKMTYRKLGYTYEGQWRQGVEHGAGTATFTNGKVCTGEFVNGQLPQGTIKYPDGAVYVGELRNLVEHGNGELSFQDESFGPTKITANFRDGEAPTGQIENSRGKGYGDIVNRKLDGDGNFTFKEGTYYGEFYRGLMHGKGEFRFNSDPPLLMYSKNWRYGNCEDGPGKLYGPHFRYVGNVVKGKPFGAGIYYNLDDDYEVHATWNENENCDGFAIIKSSRDMTRYEGNIQDFEPKGRGILYDLATGEKVISDNWNGSKTDKKDLVRIDAFGQKK